VHLALYVVTSIAVWGLLMWPFGRSMNTVAGPQYVWDLTGLHQSNPIIAMAWIPVVLSLAGLPPAAGFLGKLGLFWWGLDAELYVLVALGLLATLLGSVYYLRILKVAYIDNPTQWSFYGACHPLTAYVIAVSLLILMVGLWHGAPLILSSHLLMLLSIFKV
jgi:NADH:ubiquinone oxidoreductase subunit 2 (subunit N)